MLVRRVFGLATLALVVACGGTSRAPKFAPMRGPDRVLVVVNKQSSASQAVGQYYMAHRAIAPSHVVQVDVDVQDDISELDFRSQLLSPIRAAIDSLPVRIDFIVLTTGIPIRIGGSHGYSVDAHLAGMNLNIPPMVGFDTTWFNRYRNPYFNAREPFNSERFGMYLVTRLDCGALADCLKLVDHADSARAVRGPFYFDAMPPSTASDGYALMNRSLYAAATRLSSYGLDVAIDSSRQFIAPLAPVIGYASWGSNDQGFDATAYHAVRFLPGALAETFVSTSARTFGASTGGQSRIVDLVAQGVTGVKGYVSEPYTVALANPEILFDHYVHGFNLAESFYAASLMVLWKDIVIGDPLCSPYDRAVSVPAPRVGPVKSPFN